MYSPDEVRTLSDPATLADIARRGGTPDLRTAAVRNVHLTDEAVLAHVARTDKDEHVRAAAVERLTDPALLAAAIMHQGGITLFETALRNPHIDQASLAHIASSQYPQLARAALARLTDVRLVADVAQRGLEEIRGAAARMLPADHPLRALVLAKREDVQKLTDPAQLAGIAKLAVDRYARRAAVLNPHLTDQSFLEQLTHLGNYPEHIAAIEKLTDSARLAQIARYNIDDTSRMAAITNPNLNDQALFADLARNETLPDKLRAAAIARLTVPRLLASIAATDDTPLLRRVALENPSFNEQHVPGLLARIAQTDSDELVRAAAIGNPGLTNQALLEQVARGDSAPQVRSAAISKLTDPLSLAHFAQVDPDSQVRAIAIDRLQHASLSWLRIDSLRSGLVTEILSYLRAVQEAYDHLFVASLVTHGYDMPSPPQADVGELAATLLPKFHLQLVAVSMSSPGSWLFGGLAEPLEILRKYLADRHERRKDAQYREMLEADRLRAENRQVRAETDRHRAATRKLEAEAASIDVQNVRQRLELLQQTIQVMRDLGYSHDQIGAALQAQAAQYLAQLGRHQDTALLGGAGFDKAPST